MTGRSDDLTLRRILADTHTIAVVGAFRRFDELPSVLAETLALEQRPKTLWLQQGSWHEQVGRDAEAAGMQVVMDRPPQAGGAPSLMVDHARLR